MNKAMKGAIAAGAAGILLLGGAGTFAVWSETKQFDAGTVSTGELTLALSGATPAWTYLESGTTVTAKGIVPGDVITSTQGVTITATGDNVAGKLTVGTLGGTLPTGVTAAVTTLDDDDALETNGSVLSFATSKEYVVDVVITLTFDAAGKTSQNTAIDPAALTLTLEQVQSSPTA
jgi:alternate signal-mediated exported protein